MGTIKTFKNGIGPDASVASDYRTTHGQSAKLVPSALAVLSLLAAASGGAQTLPYSEDFTTTTYRDGAAGQTTADWTGTGQVLLPSDFSLVDPFNDTTTVEVLPGDLITGHFITRAVELADLDGDGDLDLIEGVNGANGVYLNDGTGNFGVDRAYTSPIDSNTRAIAVGDVDRDGDIDFVAGNRSSPIRLYLNNGDGTSFTIQDVAAQGRVTQSIELVDLDGDGFLDVVAANLSFQQNYIYWNTGDPATPFGNGGAAEGSELGSIKEESRRVIIGDLDNDGDIDLVFLNESEENPNDGGLRQKNRVYMNQLAQGNPRVFSHSKIDIGGGSDDIDVSHGGALGDMNGDGYLDLVVVNFLPGEVSKIYMNNASGTPNVNPFTVAWTAFTSAGNPDFAQGAKLADADHDGDLDIYMIISGHGFRNRVYFNDGTGTITGFNDVGPIGQAPLVLGDPNDVGAVTNDGALGDVDGDGDLDWVLANQETQPSNSPLANILLRNTASDSISAFQQLHARATSLTVDNISGAASVRLNPLPLTSNLGPEFHTAIDYWVSGNGGTNWSPILPDARPVPIVPGNDVRWRAELRANSPVNAATFAINQLDIEENANAPVLNNPMTQPLTVTEGQSIFGAGIFSDFSDPDFDMLYYSISGLPDGSGIRVNTFTGQLTGSPTNEDTLAQPITTAVITATDGAFSATTGTFTIGVTNTNGAPDFTSLPPDLDTGPTPATSGATQDQLYIYLITATDDDPGDTASLVISANQLPSWLTLSATVNGTAMLSGTPTAADVFVPNQIVSLVVTDLAMASDGQLFEMAIANTPDAPTFTSTPVTDVDEDSPYTYLVTTEDLDLDTLTITAPTLPTWLSLVDNGDGTATLSGTPLNADVGGHAVVLEVSDGGAPVPQSFTVTVTNTNDAPSFTSTPILTATQDVLYTYMVTTGDPDFDAVTITALTLPAWLVLVDNGDGTAVLAGTPGGIDVGDHMIQLLVSDGSPAITQDFTITVANVNDAPTFTSTAVTAATQDVFYTYAVMTNDLDGDTVTITGPTLPSWLTLVDNGDGTATLSGTPDLFEIGDHTVQLAVSDGGPATTQDFTITVADVNDAPIFTSTALIASTEGTPYSYTITVVDPEFDAVTITAPTLPAWLTFTDNGDGTATLTGTASGADVGDHAVEIQAQEDAPAAGLVTSQMFTITVTAAADGPVITLIGNASVTITVGNAYNDQGATASDPQDGDLTDQIVVDSTVNTSVAATYTVTYTVMDSAGNTAQAQRTVIVEAAPPPAPRRSGGGSMGFGELLTFAMFGLVFGFRRRRRIRLHVAS